MRNFLVLIIGCLAATSSLAETDAISKACDFVSGKLNTFKGGLYNRHDDAFEYDGKLYQGCVITVAGDRSKLPAQSLPWTGPYPYPESQAAQAGWQADRDADGPDGTSYRIFRDDVFCAIEGLWDGGDDSDPKYTPSPLFVITAKCAQSQ